MTNKTSLYDNKFNVKYDLPAGTYNGVIGLPEGYKVYGESYLRVVVTGFTGTWTSLTAIGQLTGQTGFQNILSIASVPVAGTTIDVSLHDIVAFRLVAVSSSPFTVIVSGMFKNITSSGGNVTVANPKDILTLPVSDANLTSSLVTQSPVTAWSGGDTKHAIDSKDISRMAAGIDYDYVEHLYNGLPIGGGGNPATDTQYRINYYLGGIGGTNVFRSEYLYNTSVNDDDLISEFHTKLV